jgi:hypothetical protein
MHSSRLVANATEFSQHEFDRPTVWQGRGVPSPDAANDKAARRHRVTSPGVTAKWIRSARGLEMSFASDAVSTAVEARR